MKNIKLLDCTLRDGGRIINCAFSDNEIAKLSEGLESAHIDIVEVGFLRDWRNVNYVGNSTFFTDVNQISHVIRHKDSNTLYVAFIDYGMFDFDSLKQHDGTSIDGIRFGFTKKDYLEHYNDLIKCMHLIKQHGYKLLIQGVNSLNYSDKELLQLVDLINKENPYSFGIVDTYGAMYIEDIDRIYNLINNNLNSNIFLDFHSHNNYQMSFALAQEFVKLSRGKRKIIIDGTLYGMGKVAGNLNLELIAEYLIKKLNYNYDLDILLDLIDNYITNYLIQNRWGYSIAGLMSGEYKAHPNNVIYLLEKFRIDSKDIGNILAKISPDVRQRYDYDNIKKIYIEYMSNKVDDTKTIALLKEKFAAKDVLILVPGASLKDKKQEIDDFISKNEIMIVSVNFVSKYEKAYSFIANQKRFNQIKEPKKNIILSSNIEHECDAYVVNYQSIINLDSKYFDNSTIMLLNLFRKIMPKKIYIAGFDGFFVGKKNFFNETLENSRNQKDYEDVNRETKRMFSAIRNSIVDTCPIEFLTESIFDIIPEEI